MTALDGSCFAAHRQQLPSTWCDENTFFFCFFTPKSVYFSEFYLNLLLHRIVWNLDEQTYDTEQLQTELMPDFWREHRAHARNSNISCLIS